MDKIVTATGKEFDSDYLSTIPYPAQTFFRILNTPIEEAAKVFSDPAETAKIYYCEHCLEGYTNLIAIIPESDAIKICLAK